MLSEATHIYGQNQWDKVEQGFGWMTNLVNLRKLRFWSQ